ncbi:MAG: hypothetical protein ACOX2K_01395 [Bacillota bacterium]|jgi:stage III sporulation protein AG
MSKNSTQQAVLAGVWERLGKNRMLLVALVGVVALLALQLLWPTQKLGQPLPDAVSVDQNLPQNSEIGAVNDYRLALERQLERTLSAISGVGDVSVMLSLAGSSQAIPAMNVQTTQKTTEEKDSSGGTRVTREESQSSNLLTGANNQLVTLQENLPPVTGVIIVAQGAKDAEVRLSLTRVVQTLLGIAAHRIEVIAGK